MQCKGERKVPRVLQCVAVCCSVLPCVAICCSERKVPRVLQCIAMCCSERKVPRVSPYVSALCECLLHCMHSLLPLTFAFHTLLLFALHALTLATGWPKCVGCLKLQVSFRKSATHHRALLRKMTYTDKEYYGSWPPCRRQQQERAHAIHKSVHRVGIRVTSSDYGYKFGLRLRVESRVTGLD